MPTLKLNALAIAKTPVPSKDRSELWDTDVKGLCFRITSKGARSWNIMYRIHSRQRRLKLGSYPHISLADARDLAKEAFGDLARGVDPAHKRQALKEPLPQVETLEQVSIEFLERYVKLKNRSWKETQRVFNNDIVPALGKRPFKEIKRKEIVRLIDQISDQRTPYSGRSVFVTLRRMFNWGIERGLIDQTPMAGLPNPVKTISRDRILSDEETKALWEAWTKLGYPFEGFFKVLLLTGQRRSEVAQMKWKDIDLEKGLWTLPREMTKADRLHEVPLSGVTKELLATIPKFHNCEWVFSTSGKVPISGFSKAKTRSDNISGILNWRIHDLRRTAASGMARLNVLPHVIEKVLNHSTGTISGVAAVYNRHGYQEEKRHALEAWGRFIYNLITVTPGENVVELKRKV